MLNHFLEQALQGEMDSHLAYEHSLGNLNRGNGLSTTQIKSSAGEFERSATAATNSTRPFGELHLYNCLMSISTKYSLQKYAKHNHY
jgi:hypothetical protein